MIDAACSTGCRGCPARTPGTPASAFRVEIGGGLRNVVAVSCDPRVRAFPAARAARCRHRISSGSDDYLPSPGSPGTAELGPMRTDTAVQDRGACLPRSSSGSVAGAWP
jgi:hypothetical protein